MLVGSKGMSENRSLTRSFSLKWTQNYGLAQSTINTRWTCCEDVRIEHHEGQSTIPLKGIFSMELQERISLGFIWPMIPWDGSIVLVDVAVAVLPVEKLIADSPEPRNYLRGWDLGLMFSMIVVIDKRNGTEQVRFSPRWLKNKKSRVLTPSLGGLRI